MAAFKRLTFSAEFRHTAAEGGMRRTMWTVFSTGSQTRAGRPKLILYNSACKWPAGGGGGGGEEQQQQIRKGPSETIVISAERAGGILYVTHLLDSRNAGLESNPRLLVALAGFCSLKQLNKLVFLEPSLYADDQQHAFLIGTMKVQEEKETERVDEIWMKPV